jgi:hypothetical protein
LPPGEAAIGGRRRFVDLPRSLPITFSCLPGEQERTHICFCP